MSINSIGIYLHLSLVVYIYICPLEWLFHAHGYSFVSIFSPLARSGVFEALHEYFTSFLCASAPSPFVRQFDSFRGNNFSQQLDVFAFSLVSRPFAFTDVLDFSILIDVLPQRIFLVFLLFLFFFTNNRIFYRKRYLSFFTLPARYTSPGYFNLQLIPHSLEMANISFPRIVIFKHDF